jgi:HK97 family phage major capsid protein
LLRLRGLFTQVPTAQRAIDVVKEAFTNAAAIQGNDSSPTGSGEGALKAESGMTFSLATLQIPTVAHHIVASRQILSDAPRLQGHIENRLIYGLALVEEAQFLTGDGTGLSMSGLNTQATVFSGGVTNATALDTLARAINQLALNNCEADGIVLHPTDWLAIKLLKTTTGEYLLGDPATMTLRAFGAFRWCRPRLRRSASSLCWMRGRRASSPTAKTPWCASPNTTAIFSSATSCPSSLRSAR